MRYLLSATVYCYIVTDLSQPLDRPGIYLKSLRTDPVAQSWIIRQLYTGGHG
jgi:hypothetical protein